MDKQIAVVSADLQSAAVLIDKQIANPLERWDEVTPTMGKQIANPVATAVSAA